jgi:antirestriction protein ArdC
MKQDVIIKMVNDKVIEGLTQKGFDWFKPWKAGDENQPMNYVNKTFYKGFNIFLLNSVMMDKGYDYNQWLTFKQCSNLNGKVKKGSKSTEVFFCKVGYQDMKTGRFLTDKQVKEVNLREKFTTEQGNVINRYRQTFTWKYYRVFNVQQCEGIEPIETAKVNNVHQPNEIAEQISSSYINRDGKLRLNHGGDRACYNRVRDAVTMPKPESFVDSDSYYKVLFHELAHSTGHESRLDRKTLQEIENWGDETYAQEELVAEISAMYLVGMLDLNPHDSVQNSQAYIKGWCKNIADKPKACFYAMQQAVKAVNCIKG